jgi:hypothetical protein
MEGGGRNLMSGMMFNVVMVMMVHNLVLCAIAGSGMVVVDTG